MKLRSTLISKGLEQVEVKLVMHLMQILLKQYQIPAPSPMKGKLLMDINWEIKLFDFLKVVIGQ
jgi:hypothetical protein